jgi:hypothetical protein
MRRQEICHIGKRSVTADQIRGRCRQVRQGQSIAERQCGGIRGAAFADRGDKLVPAAGQGLNEARLLRTVPERASDVEDVTLQHLRLDVCLGPHGLDQLIVRHQPSGVLDQVLQDGKRLRC